MTRRLRHRLIRWLARGEYVVVNAKRYNATASYTGTTASKIRINCRFRDV